MHEPTLEQIEAANPIFFQVSQGPDKLRSVVQDGGDFVLRVLTYNGTRPVYRINKDHTLQFLRHGW